MTTKSTTKDKRSIMTSTAPISLATMVATYAGAVSWYWYLTASVLLTVWYMVLRPRRAAVANAPPMVLSSPVFPIPVIGVICEFFYGPNDMIRRCYEQYGPVFTIPVSSTSSDLVFYVYSFHDSKSVDRYF
jgi:hypothetical protein